MRKRFNLYHILLIVITTWGGVISVSAQALIAYYPFDNSADDASGNKNNGVQHGGLSFVADRFGNPCRALLFNGSTGYIEVPNSTTLQLPTTNFSVSCWFKIESATCSGDLRWLTIICKGDISAESSNNPQYRLQTFQSQIQSTISVNTEFTEYDQQYASHQIIYDKWCHYVLVYDGTYVKAYINTKQIWEFPYHGNLNVNNAPLHIGKDIPGSTEFFCGALDDLRIYQTALNTSDITKLYKEQHEAFTDDLSELDDMPDITANADPGGCTAKVPYQIPTIDLGCGKVEMRLIKGLPSGSNFPLGITQVIYKIETASGASKSIKFKVTVKDNQAPKITCPADTTMSTNNPAGVTFAYTIPVAISQCSIADVALVQGLPSGSNFPVGKTTLQFKARDQSGAEVYCQYKVTVLLKEEKQQIITDSIKCPSDISQYNDHGICGASISFVNNKSAEVLSGMKWKVINGSENGSVFPVGTTTNKVVFTYKKASRECIFRVTVSDHEKPIILCPKDSIIELASQEKGIAYHYMFPKATDNCKVESIKLESGLNSGDFFPLGKTRNVYRAIDGAGNFSECSFIIQVVLKPDTSKQSKAVLSSMNIPLPIATKDMDAAKSYLEAAGLKDSVKVQHEELIDDSVITIIIYDDGFVDNDTVSIYFNESAIWEKIMLQRKHDKIQMQVLKLKKGENNYLTAKAWNVGSVPPNTMAIEIFSGDMTSSAKGKAPIKPLMMRKLNARPNTAATILIKRKY
jgi:hypothetical protein